MVAVRIHIEGGDDTAQLCSRCRAAFTTFFEKAGLKGHMPSVVACGSRNDARKSFLGALKMRKKVGLELVLVDSEEPVAEGYDVWQHLRSRDGWERPEGVDDDSAHLMVQCMEAWFLADREALSDWFGAGFNAAKLPAGTDLELVSKSSVLDGLEKSTQKTKKKEPYDKGKHSFAILAVIAPAKVADRSPHARRLLETLKRHLKPD